MVDYQDKVNILLVDDRPENLIALEAIIESDQYNLVKAHSGEEALKYLLKYDFAAILLDVQMPGMDGFETAKYIKAREKCKNIPIIFITANNMDAKHVFQGYDVGAVDYMIKPVDPNMLKAKVQRFVELFQMNQQLVQQTEALAQKNSELEMAYRELTSLSTELKQSETLANVISETSLDAMLVINEEGIILKVNPAFFTMFAYDEDEIVGSNIKDILSTLSNVDEVIEEKRVIEATATRKDGTIFPAEFQVGKDYLDDKMIIACTIRDVTKVKESQQLITHMAYHDGLTNLPNKRLFNDTLILSLNEAKVNDKSLVMMYLDMDKFKQINDSLGHLIGDRLLQEIAKRLQSAIREGDFVARIGGDEFNILLPDTNREQALEIADDVLKQLKKPFYIENYELYLTVSIGISVYPFDGEDPLTLMKNADAALYRAKELGRDKFQIYHSGMNIEAYRRYTLQNDLRKAIENEEFFLVYQPRVDIKTGKINGAEALVRWNHPNWGLLSPVEFIPLAEETGHIVQLGEWVLKTACEQNRTWQKAGLKPVRIAVNFSAQQFMQKNLMSRMKTILTQFVMDPHLLEVEITESAIVQNEETVSKTLNEMKQMGICISLDDFGTGYSSLNYLRRFPIDIVKIDRAFIQDLPKNEKKNVAIIESIVQLAHSLNMEVIAEGVETEEQLNIVNRLKCESVQGFLYSPPVPPQNLETMLSKGFPLKPAALPKEEKPADLQNVLDLELHRLKESFSISSRELEVFRLVLDGLNNREISGELFISEHTVKNHITRIFQKLEVSDRLQAMALVYQTCIKQNKSMLA